MLFRSGVWEPAMALRIEILWWSHHYNSEMGRLDETEVAKQLMLVHQEYKVAIEGL